MPTFDWTPKTAEKTVTPRVKVARFGDGYEQRVVDGINAQAARWSLTFSRETADLDAIEAFLRARGAAEAFDWLAPGATATIRVVCREWTRTPHTGLRTGELSCTFEEVFE
jgi:phage-related protein